MPVLFLKPGVPALLAGFAIALAGCGGSDFQDPIVYEEQVHKMWDVWFDTAEAQRTTQTPLVLDLNGDGKLGITGKNILGDGKLDGSPVLFDINPNEISFEFKSDHNRPGAGLPVEPGGYWVNELGQPADEAPPAGIQKGHAGWKYLDAGGQLVGQIKGDGLYHYGSQEPREQTEWLAAGGGDGFLVSDDNGDGQINDATELFGSYGRNGEKYGDGFQKLAALYDSNGDGVLSGDELTGLQVWKDDNANGVVDSGELLSLASLGVASINLSYDKDTMEGSYTIRVPKSR